MNMLNVKPLSFLRREILKLYVKEITDELSINKKILASDWTSTGTEYHNQCRADMEAENEVIKKQIKFLTT